MFYLTLDQPELDKIQTIKELLCVMYRLISLPLFDVSQINFMVVTVYWVTIFTFYFYFCTILY